MSKERCIPLKKELLSYISTHYSDFIFQGMSGCIYAFRRTNDDGIFDYFFIQRDFCDGIVYLVISEAASCYNSNWKGIPWFTIGFETDIGVLVTGNNRYDANIGWHRCENKKEELESAFSALGADIDTYVLPFLSNSHAKIKSDKHLTITITYMQTQLEELSEEEIESFKNFLMDINKSYCEYRNMCKKANQKEKICYFDIIPPHPLLEKWLRGIQHQLNYSHLSQDVRTRLIKYITILFRDIFGFYNLN